MFYIFVYLGRAIRDHGPMPRISPPTELLRHTVQTLHIASQVLKHCSPMPQHIVSREHGVFFLQNERHVIGGMARAMEGAERRALHLEFLAVADVVPSLFGIVFMDFGRRGEGEE